MLFVVSSCPSQGNWTWYREKRPLTHLQLFEDASRGPLGALNLVISWVAIPITLIRTTITLLALAFDPSVQQVLTYPSIHVECFSNSSTVKQAAGLFTLPFSANTLNALKKVVWSDTLEQIPSCAATNCTWGLV